MLALTFGFGKLALTLQTYEQLITMQAIKYCIFKNLTIAENNIACINAVTNDFCFL